MFLGCVRVCFFCIWVSRGYIFWLLDKYGVIRVDFKLRWEVLLFSLDGWDKCLVIFVSNNIFFFFVIIFEILIVVIFIFCLILMIIVEVFIEEDFVVWLMVILLGISLVR